MSFLGILNTIGGLASGYTPEHDERRQEAYQQAQDKAAQARQAQQDAEQRKLDADYFTDEKQKQDAYTRNTGVDPATGKPFILPPPLTQINPNNKGKGGVPNLQQLYNHYSGLAQYYAGTGQTDKASFAASQAAETGRQMAAQQTQNAEMQRDIFNQNAQNVRQYNAFLQQNHLQDTKENFDLYIHQQPTYADLHPKPGAGAVAPHTYAHDLATWYGSWSKATKSPGLKNPNLPPSATNPMLPPAIPPGIAKLAGPMFSRIDNSPDPIATAQKFAASTPNPTLKQLLLDRASVAASKNAVQPGGSNAPPNFPG